MNDRLVNYLLDEIEGSRRTFGNQLEQFVRLASLGDVLAHQGMFKDAPGLYDAWWKARGGHWRCTVCNGGEISSELGAVAQRTKESP